MVVYTNRNYLGLEQERQGQAARISVASPTGGLNTRDSEALMEATDATELTNWFPGQGYVVTRKGFTEYATGLTGDVETLAELNTGSSRKFICANSDEINDITTPASISNLGSGFANARWQTANFNGNMLLVNGADTPQVYDGSSLSNSTITGSGLTAANIIGVNIHKSRVYVWEDDSASFWYGATNAIGGTFNEFNLSRLGARGGKIVSMMTWNHDGGDGVDDYAAFFMSSGEVFLYDGSDPGDAANWSLIGVFSIGSPLAIRGFAKIAGDIAIICAQGFVFFSDIFKSEGARITENKLAGAAIEAVEDYSSNYGWEVAVYPKASIGGWLLFNVPKSTNDEYVQYVVNTVTGATAKFDGMNARTWSLYNDNLYFGESTKVMKADDGFSDNGNYIVCTAQGAYSDLTTPAEKTLNSFRNVIKVDGNVVLNTTVSFDYGQGAVTQDVSSTSSGTPWGSAWGSPWSPHSATRSELVLSSGQGVALGMRIKTSLNGQQLKWYRTDYNINVNNIV